MPHRKLMTVDEFRRRVWRGLSDTTLNGHLKAEIHNRASNDDEKLSHIVDALGCPMRLDHELIVDAAEFGNVAAVAAMVKLVPAEAAQDYFDRALISVAINDWAPPENYTAITKILLEHGANPEAYETRCRQLANTSKKKEGVYALICAAIDTREEARDRAARAAFQHPKKSAGGF